MKWRLTDSREGLIYRVEDVIAWGEIPEGTAALQVGRLRPGGDGGDAVTGSGTRITPAPVKGASPSKTVPADRPGVGT